MADHKVAKIFNKSPKKYNDCLKEEEDEKIDMPTSPIILVEACFEPTGFGTEKEIPTDLSHLLFTRLCSLSKRAKLILKNCRHNCMSAVRH